ncbi:armadillo-type protein [Obelidium mucronatum]|nr:armadillo-type protein [Obelidium mucronatum]
MGKSSKHSGASRSSNASSSSSGNNSSNSTNGSNSSGGGGGGGDKSGGSGGAAGGGLGSSLRRSQDEMSEFIDWESELGVSSESIDDDIKGTDEVKVFTRLHKTDEEIQTLSLDEDLDEVKRIMLLIRTGQNVQLPAVLGSLQRLLKTRRKETMTQIFPLLLESLPTRLPDFQIMAASVIYDIIEKGMLPDVLADEIHHCAARLLNSKDEDVSAVWGDVLIVSIKYMTQKAIYESILPGCHSYSGLSQPVPLRIWSCRMLGAVTSRLKSAEIEALFQKAITLCQDTDYEVRACMCHQLNEFVRYVRLDSIRRSLFHEYVELIMDEEDFVREAALANIVKLTEFVDDSTKTNIVVPIWRKLCTEKPARLMELMARDFGAFLYNTKCVLSDGEVKFFIEFYHSMVFSTEEDLRIWSAFNFPGVLKAVGVEAYEFFKLDQAMSHLSMDQVIEVKRRLTCGFHEVVEILDKKSQYYLRNIFLRLLSDSEVDVYEPLFKNLNVILKGFALDESGRKTAQFDELLFSILRKEREYASNASYKLTWRIHHALLDQFKFFIDYFDSEYIHDQCVPLLFKLLSDNVTIPIKQTIIETLCIYLRKMRRLENRMKIIRNIADLRESSNYHTRLLFMWTLKSIYSHFSHHFIRETFFDEFLDMARDTVPNIRLAFVAQSYMFRRSLFRRFQAIQQQNPLSYGGSGGGGGGGGGGSGGSYSNSGNQYGQFLQMQQQLLQQGPSSTSNLNGPNNNNNNSAGSKASSFSSQQQQYQAALMSNITRLNECLMALCGDQDRDVASAAQDELERLGIGSRRGTKALILGLDDSSESVMGEGGGRGYALTESEAAEDREREEYEERLLATEIEEDTTTSLIRRRDDDSVVNMGGIGGGIGGGGIGGGGGVKGKRTSVAGKHSAAKPTPTTASHRKSLVAKNAPIPPQKSGTPAASGFPVTSGIANPRSVGLANRVMNANHGSLTQLATSSSNNPMGSLPSEGLKRGKSAGPVGKSKGSGAKGSGNSPTSSSAAIVIRPSFDESNYSTTSELGSKKKSLGSLINKQTGSNPPKTAAIGGAVGGGGGGAAAAIGMQRKDLQQPALSSSMQPRKPIETQVSPTSSRTQVSTPSSRSSISASNSSQGVIGMRSLTGGGGITSIATQQSQLKNKTQQLPPIDGSASPSIQPRRH